MPCYHPLKAWRAKRPGVDGRRGIVFSLASASVTEPLSVPCGKCIGCKMLIAQAWAMRAMHEAQFHELNCFVTLTYSDRNLPEGGTLRPTDLVLFMKRLRKFIEPVRISFFACGEYGDIGGRPHYHALLFGMDFLDKTLWKDSSAGKMFLSPTLERLWGHGFTSVGPVTAATAAYVARYVTKKVGKDESAYECVDKDGVIHKREPEFARMSRRPAIGRKWIEKFASDVYPDDFCVREGKEVGVPRYYDKRLEIENAALFAAVKAERLGAMLSDEAWKDSKPSRLAVREIVAQAKINLRKGTL